MFRNNNYMWDDIFSYFFQGFFCLLPSDLAGILSSLPTINALLLLTTRPVSSLDQLVQQYAS